MAINIARFYAGAAHYDNNEGRYYIRGELWARGHYPLPSGFIYYNTAQKEGFYSIVYTGSIYLLHIWKPSFSFFFH